MNVYSRIKLGSRRCHLFVRHGSVGKLFQSSHCFLALPLVLQRADAEFLRARIISHTTESRELQRRSKHEQSMNYCFQMQQHLRASVMTKDQHNNTRGVTAMSTHVQKFTDELGV